MAERVEEVKLDEFQQIVEHIKNEENFLLSGGAGSGKTYSLVQVIKYAISENPTSKIACMTYTNAAVKEIEERVNHNNLNVSTIHDFLWDNIKHFQKELKAALVILANEPAITKIKIEGLTLVPDTFFDNCEDGIQYKEYLKIKDGIISHDELLILANYMFSNYPKLCDILKDRYKFIFIDEYQDTHKEVVEIFLDHLKKSNRKTVVGFFGDSMQSIYEDGIGNIDSYRDSSDVLEVKKEQNRRNPKLIIQLANKLRTDGIEQKPSDDLLAPNMNEDGTVKEGNLKFIYSANDNLEDVKNYLNWNFADTKETKELNLTHNLIAGKAGFRTLMDIYDKDPIIGLKKDILKKIKDNKENNRQEIEINDEDSFDIVVDKFALKNRQRQLKKDVILQDHQNVILYNQLKDLPFLHVKKIYLNKDSLIDDKKQDESDLNKKGSKRDNLIKHLFKIENCIFLYKSKRYNEFLRATDYRIHIVNIEQKRTLKTNIEALCNVSDKTISQVIQEAHEMGICIIDDKFKKFETENEYIFNRVKDVKFSEFQKLYEYLEGKTPFSTQHKTKGAEYKNVLVVLDNGKWNDYNFENLFLNNGSESVLNRTQKIFYVCCTRAKENLAVFYHNPSPEVITKAKEWFGVDNIKEI